MEIGSVLTELIRELSISEEEFLAIAGRFRQEIEAGLKGNPSSLKMLPSFFATPTGREEGVFFAVDFGGTNVRVLAVELKGGACEVLGKRVFMLKDPEGQWDYISPRAEGEALFDRIAAETASLAKEVGAKKLGFTFSFPCRQQDIKKAELIIWTKEIKTAGVEGRDVGEYLQTALRRKGIENIQVQAIINDTVGTLLTAAYQDVSADVGSICGTGHNTCYYEPVHPLTGKGMIINLESGNFSQLPVHRYDEYLDQNSEQPGAQRLEKMVAGRYLGELMRQGMLEWAKKKIGFTEWEPGESQLTGEDVALIVGDTSIDLETVAEVLGEKLGYYQADEDEREAVHTLASLLTIRSARLVAATFLGILWHIDPEMKASHVIGIDGSLYKKMPGYQKALGRAMGEALWEKAGQVKIISVEDGSGIGAAVAAALAGEDKGHVSDQETCYTR